MHLLFSLDFNSIIRDFIGTSRFSRMVPQKVCYKIRGTFSGFFNIYIKKDQGYVRVEFAGSKKELADTVGVVVRL